jgi:thiamine biosynthesis lipoprotein
MKQLLLTLLLISTVLSAKELQRTQVLMGTFVSITLDEQNQHEINNGFQLLKEIENSLSSYKKSALLYTLNKEKRIQADHYLLDAIQKSQKMYQLSNGYFNIAIGSITKKLYKFGEKESIPTKKSLENATVDINSIHINNQTISISPETTLDLGGIGKGYAVDKLAEYYREQNIRKGTIALSGDIQLLHPTTLYIESQNTHAIAKLETLHPNTSISTSGTYRRYVKTQEHHHLINPKSKQQGKSFSSITLITKQDNTMIDALATALGVMSEEEVLAFLLKHPEIGYILVKPNGNILYGNLEELSRVTWL